MYIPLHVHTDKGSVGDSTLNIKEYVSKAKEFGLTHLAITDHGSMSSIVDFYDECKKNDIIPIIGMEAYVSNNIDNTVKDKERGADCSHLVLLAKNQEGIKNLLRIHNDAQINGFYYKPRTSIKKLQEFGDNLICLSACVGGLLPQLILKEDVNACIRLIHIYKSIFKDFYLEIQPGIFPEQIKVNKAIARLALHTNTNIVVTNDVHYLDAEDYLAHNYHVQSVRHANVSSMAYPDKCYYLMDENELKKWFNISGVKDEVLNNNIINTAISNTVNIANMCNGEVDWQFEMPKFKDLPNGETDDSYLYKICYSELHNRITSVSDPQIYEDRLEYELDTIKELGFSGYFLIIWDLLRYAKSQDIAVGPGRGSCGGSLVSWLLNITIADPIKYNLLFERFLSKNRSGLPDIDIDIQSDRRHELQLYTLEKYGEDCCALVMTYTIRKAKTAIKDAARMLNIDVDLANKISKLIPVVFYGEEGDKMTDLSIEKALQSVPEFKQYESQYPDLFAMAKKIEGIPSGCNGVHAAGVVISPTSLNTKVPLKLHYDKINDITLPTACITKENIERIAIKFDYLSLQTVSIISKTQKDAGINIDLSDEDFFNDEEVWKTIGSSNTDGMFQIGSNTYKQRMPRLKPKSIEELAACLALIRSPSILAKADEEYMQIIEGKKQPTYISPEHKKVTKNTNGICIYQEQVMQLAVEYGFDLDKAYDILKAASKKKVSQLKLFETEFKNKIAERGQTKEQQDKIFQIILDAGTYAFNSSHAICYSLNTYVSAWLKYHCSDYFMANFLTNIYDNSKDATLKNIIKECKDKGITFLPLDINMSKWEFVVEEKNKIRIGFCAVKCLGKKAVNNILSNIPYESLEDFLNKINGRTVNKTNIIMMIFSGCFDCFIDENSDRVSLYKTYCQMKKIDISDTIKINKESSFKITEDSNKIALKILKTTF